MKTITRNNDGSLTISKPIHGNLDNIYHMKYIGYSKREASAKFSEAFKKEEQKYFINKPAKQ